MEPVYVRELHITNFLRLESVDLTLSPDGGLTAICGDNGAGKSSVFAAIKAAFGGEKEIPSRALRLGTEEGDVIVIVSTKTGTPVYKVHRKLRGDNSYLEVTDLRVPAKVKSPQALLSDLLGAVTFRATDFADPPGAETPERADALRRDMLLRSAKLSIDLLAHDRLIEEAAQARLAAHRDLERIKKTYAGPKDAGGAPEAPAGSTAEIVSTEEDERLLDAARRANAEHARVQSEVDVLKREKADLEARLKAVIERLTQRTNLLHATKVEDTAPIEKRLAERRAANADVQRRSAEIALAQQARRAWEQAQSDHAAADERVRLLREQRAEALRSAKFPVPSLTIMDDGTVGIIRPDKSIVPFSQLSGAQRLACSFAVMAATCGDMRLALLPDVNGLDGKHMAALANMARKAGIQVLCERVVADQPGSVIIEEGRVRSAPAAGGAS